MKYFIVIGIILVLICNLSPLHAEEESNYFAKESNLEKNKESLNLDKIEDKREKEVRYEYSLGKYIFKTIFALGIIGLAIFLVIKLFVRSHRNIIGGDKESIINILGNAPLAPNRYLQLVEIAQKVLLLGVTENNISILTEIKDKEQIDLIKAHQGRILSKEGFPFKFHLSKMLKKFKWEGNQVSFEDRVNFMDKQKDRLKKL